MPQPSTENTLLANPRDVFYTIAKSARVIGVTPKQIAYFMDVRLLPFVVVSRNSRRIRAIDLDRFVTRHARSVDAFRAANDERRS